ncbi:hypothetical protein ASPZODRAFT_19188 [Penicilliopsis zonata CBS 506.65]|uniref:Cytochrome P450 n=1 Tax=Penicilliopsis zonata CBS 506.65 TaxID=1073090 RepID=A0A1L9S9R9_9EURO|nr:hypothetical protein ASPZODRAFT_19188 [Penicilliopsis zonata CBS 506.65]OJJ43888.1 hypothetical protein ASPZODRAFT_19188 [Penicilliopsis zonata CBS 506.65]
MELRSFAVSVDPSIQASVVLILGIGVILCFCPSLVRTQNFPSSIIWVGRKNQMFSVVRACLREYTAGLSTVLDGYEKYSKAGKPFILPAIGFDAQIVLPPDHIKWLIAQPKEILSSRAVQSEKVGIKYIAPNFTFNYDHALIEALRVDMIRNMGRVQSELVDEIRAVVDETLGTDKTSWKEVNVFDAMHMIVFRASSRVLYGRDLCHNDHFIQSSLRLATWFGLGIMVVGQVMPWPLRRFVGSVIAIPIAYYRRQCTNHLWPLLAERFEKMKRKKLDPGFEYSPPGDMITWMTRTAIDMKDQTIESPKPVASVFTMVNAGAISSSAVTATHLFLDLLGYDSDLEYYHALRHEAEAAFDSPEAWLQPSRFFDLHRTDSTVRETLRRSPMTNRGLARQVMPPDGVTLPDGQHLRQGTWIGVAVPGIHRDERFYPDPDAYQPFRFAPEQTEQQGSNNGDHKRTLLVTTSDTFLSFGHARRACPGRWFASHVLQLLLAYITVHYDVQPLGKRPANAVWGDHLVPPTGTKMKVRRREVRQ